MGQTAPRWPSSPGSSTCGVGAEVGVFLETKAFSLLAPVSTVSACFSLLAPFHCFGNGLIQNISHIFLGGLGHLHFSKKLINVIVHVGHAVYYSRIIVHLYYSHIGSSISM